MKKRRLMSTIPTPKGYQTEFERDGRLDLRKAYFAEVEIVHSDRHTVDVIHLSSRAHMRNIPVPTVNGLIDEEVYGVLDLPSVGETVVVGYVGGREGFPYVAARIIPYLFTKYQSSQTPVNSGSKQFTTKLLEVGKENTYRRIYKSGATFEVDEDGAVIIETPSGQYIKIDEDGSKIDFNGNLEVLK